MTTMLRAVKSLQQLSHSHSKRTKRKDSSSIANSVRRDCVLKTARGSLIGTEVVDTRDFQPIYQLYARIRYAIPPIGERRWAKPDPLPTDWLFSYDMDNPRDYRKFGHICPQLDGEYAAIDTSPWPDTVENVMDEDCLYLNIWVPSGVARPDGGFPVQFNFPSNDLQSGDGMQHSFLDPIDIFREHRDDARILVSANFRVGILGFLSSEDLMWDGLDMSTRVSDSAGNFGLWDLRLALQWTYDHIHLFGGDASNISAGGAGYVTALQLHYDAFQAPDERIIRRAFLFSGAVGIQPEQANSAKPGRQFAELCSQLGVGDDLTPQAKMRLLRAVPATRLLEVARLLETEYCPVTDGKGGFVPTWLMASIWNGELGRRLKQRNVQVVIGDTADERSFYEYCGQNPGSRHRMPRAISTRDGTLAKLKAFFPEDVCQALVVRYAREITDWNSVYCDIMADLQCHAVVRGFAQCLFYGGMTTQDVFRYHIAWRAKSFEAWIDPGLGVSHVVEMPVWWYAGWLAGFARKDKQDILQFAAPFARFLHGDSSLHIHWGTEAEFEVRALGDDGAVMCMEDSMWMKKIGVWNTIRDVQRERYEKKGG